MASPRGKENSRIFPASVRMWRNPLLGKRAKIQRARDTLETSAICFTPLEF